jgi:hypothetical protein
MFARVSVYENVDLDMAERIKEWVEAARADPFGALPGYRGSMTLVDRDNARLVGIGLYATAGEAREADALLTRCRSASRALASTTPSIATDAGHVPAVPARPCRHNGAPDAYWLPLAIVAAARRLRRSGSRR